MCPRDVQKGDGEGIVRVVYDHVHSAAGVSGGGGTSGAELEQYHNEGISGCIEARRKARQSAGRARLMTAAAAAGGS